MHSGLENGRTDAPIIDPFLLQTEVVQGGMGIFMSSPELAKEAALAGALGTVSGTACERILPRILQRGDPGGHMRRALKHFPFPEVANWILDTYFIPGGKKPKDRFKKIHMFTFHQKRELIWLTVASSFCFVWLAKEGHNRPISVNYLEKLQIGHVYHLTGAMLAGVDYVTMGAGITMQIPGVLNALAEGRPASYRVDVEGAKEKKVVTFDPREFFGEKFPAKLKRPGFLPIVSSHSLASVMNAELPGEIQGFIVELPEAGGHNAPPRKWKGDLDEKGGPLYTEKDRVDWDKMKSLGLPFWIGGGFASPEKLAEAKKLGAVGVQAGSIFALSRNSGMKPTKRRRLLRKAFRGELEVRRDPRASPTKYPINLAQVEGTDDEYRERDCSIEALQFPVEHKGKTVFRCPAAPLKEFIGNGGKPEDADGRRCLCNGLFALVNLGGPTRKGTQELAMITMGEDTSFARRMMKHENDSWTAADAVKWLLSLKSAETIPQESAA